MSRPHAPDSATVPRRRKGGHALLVAATRVCSPLLILRTRRLTSSTQIAVYAKLYPLRDQLNKVAGDWDTQEVVRFLSLVNNFRALSDSKDTFLEIFEYLNVGHAVPSVGIHSHQCKGLVMQFYIECFMQMRKYPSCFELLRFFLCLSATQLCHYAEIAEGTGISVMKIRLKLHELVNNFEQMDTKTNADLDAQDKACIELLEQADPMMVSLPDPFCCIITACFARWA